MREDAFGIRIVGRLDEQHGIESANVRMPFEDVSSRRAIERRKSQRTPGIAGQDELNARGAKAARAVVEKDW